jgi:hypothetical protein
MNDPYAYYVDSTVPAEVPPGPGNHRAVSAPSAAVLSEDEDQDLRRLTLLMTMGELSPHLERRYQELRGRGRPGVTRPPTQLVIPIQRQG